MEQALKHLDKPQQLDAEWVGSMTTKLEVFNSNKQVSVGPCTISRVPENIRESDPKAYQPTVVSIGPLHGSSSSNNLQATEEVKWRCVDQLLARYGDSHQAKKLFCACLLKMKTLEADARRCYPKHSFDLSSDEFAEILLLDGCFIIFLLLKEYESDKASNCLIDDWLMLPRSDSEDLEEVVVVKEDEVEEMMRECSDNSTDDDGLLVPKGDSEDLVEVVVVKEDEVEEMMGECSNGSTDDDVLFIPKGDATAPLVGNLWMSSVVKCDLLKLENQIPFNVIEALYDLLRIPGYRNTDLLGLALNFFSRLYPIKAEKGSRIRNRDVKHLLHLFYLSLIPSSFEEWQPRDKPPTPTDKLPKWIPSATKLWKDGVTFRKKKSSSSFLEIKFHKWVMEIPPLHIYNYSNSIFRNLIAFEEGFPIQPAYITIYALFMACMTRTGNDVELLQSKGILLNGQGSDEEEFSHFFSCLCRGLQYSYQPNYLWDLFIQVRNYHESSCARLRRCCLGSRPGRRAAFAIIFLVLGKLVLSAAGIDVHRVR